MFPPWLLPTAAAVASVLSAVVLWGFASGKWVQGREDDHGEIEKLRRELERLRELDRTDTVALRRELERLEDERRQWAERVNVDIGKLQGQAASEEKLWLLRLQHVDEQVRALHVEVDTLTERTADLQRQIDQRGRAR
jgi:chromosome segregation ATPase